MLSLEKGRYLRIVKIIWFTFLGGLVFLTLYIAAINYNFLGLFGKMPSLEVLENPKSELASEIYTADGVLMGKYFTENRTSLEFDEISPYLINALLATEDIRFEEHSGVDLRGTMRVFGKTIFMFDKSSGGGSTLTQQLAKNLFKTRSKDYKGILGSVPVLSTVIIKTKEWVTAIKLEKNYTKKEIITMYLNTVEFGSNSFGIQTAARTFFGKDANELSVQEAALLIGLLQAPSKYSPVANPKNALERRNTVLGQMHKYDFLTTSQFDSLKQKPITLSYTQEDHVQGIAPYFREVAKQYLLDWAKENGKNIYTDGLKIYTTIDSRMQEYAEESMREHMRDKQKLFNEHWKGMNPWVDEYNREIPYFIENVAKRTERYRYLKTKYDNDTVKIYAEMRKKIPMKIFAWDGERDTLMSPMDSIRYYKRFLNIGFMSMEPKTGYIKAWVGGINFRYFRYDHVKQAVRQPGSTFKPIVYAAAIDNGFTPCYQLVDQPIRIGNWVPRNSYGGYSGASMTLKKALGMSVNSITAQLMAKLGPDLIIKYARDLGITTPIPRVPSICLGSSDVSLYDLLGAYNTFPSKGYWTEPIFITKITDKNGNIVAEFTPKIREVLSEENAYLMLHMLKGGTEPGGTSVGLAPYGVLKNNEVGGKTGTTQNQSDAWFVGVTKDLVSGLWVGGDDRSIRFRSIYYGQGAMLALPAWGIYMKKIYEDKALPYKRGAFEKPAEMSVSLDCSKIPQLPRNFQ